MEQAHELFGALCARANPLGLLPEQIDPTSGAFLGNFPQAFSHIGLISSAVNLVQAQNDRSELACPCIGGGVFVDSGESDACG